MRKLPKKHKNIPKVAGGADLSGILNLGGSAIDAVDAIDGKKSMGLQGLSGAATGAASGFAVGGPIGAIAGGLIGGVTKLFSTKADNERTEREQRQAREAKEKAVRTTNDLASRSILQNFPTQGIERPMMAKGGDVTQMSGALNSNVTATINNTGYVRPNGLPKWDEIGSYGLESGTTTQYNPFKEKDAEGRRTFNPTIKGNYMTLYDKQGKYFSDISPEYFDAHYSHEVGKKFADLKQERYEKKLAQQKKTLGKGGIANPDYIAEGGELISHDPLNPPLAEKTGMMKKISSGVSEVKGAKHSQGGVPVKGGERVYSDQIPVPKQFLKVLNKL